MAHAHDAHDVHYVRGAQAAHDVRGVEVPDAPHFHDFRHELVPIDALLDVQLLSPAVVVLQRFPSGAELRATLAGFLQR